MDGRLRRLRRRAHPPGRGAAPGRPARRGGEQFARWCPAPAAEGLAAQVQDAVDKGATLHAGGTLADGPVAYFAPAVLTGVTPDMRAYHEELFGPVAVVYKVSDDEEALGPGQRQLVRARRVGVEHRRHGAGPQGRRPARRRHDERQHRRRRRADMPFGGIKRSGFGRELGPLGIEEFVNKRLFYVHELSPPHRSERHFRTHLACESAVRTVSSPAPRRSESAMARYGAQFGPDITFLGVPEVRLGGCRDLPGRRRRDPGRAVRRRHLAPLRHPVRPAAHPADLLPAARRFPAVAGDAGRRAAGPAGLRRRRRRDVLRGRRALGRGPAGRGVRGGPRPARSRWSSAATTRSPGRTRPAWPSTSGRAGSR